MSLWQPVYESQFMVPTLSNTHTAEADQAAEQALEKSPSLLMLSV